MAKRDQILMNLEKLPFFKLLFEPTFDYYGRFQISHEKKIRWHFTRNLGLIFFLLARILFVCVANQGTNLFAMVPTPLQVPISLLLNMNAVRKKKWLCACAANQTTIPFVMAVTPKDSGLPTPFPSRNPANRALLRTRGNTEIGRGLPGGWVVWYDEWVLNLRAYA